MAVINGSARQDLAFSNKLMLPGINAVKGQALTEQAIHHSSLDFATRCATEGAKQNVQQNVQSASHVCCGESVCFEC